MKQIVSFLAAFLLAAGLASGQSPSAEQVLSQAKAKASADQKAIFVHFGASWCVWCRRLDAFLERPDIKPVFEKYFVPVKLVVQEGDKKKGLENAGAETLLKEWGGPAGLPYFVFLDAQGTVMVNSKREGQNIGFPAKPEEIDWFVQMMRKAAPKMAADDLKVIEAALKAPKGT